VSCNTRVVSAPRRLEKNGAVTPVDTPVSKSAGKAREGASQRHSSHTASGMTTSFITTHMAVLPSSVPRMRTRALKSMVRKARNRMVIMK
jgi:predicted nuclease with RNAse H fold